MEFSEKFRKLREEKNLTQADVAKALGVTLKTVSNYELLGTKPRYKKRYEQIADVFGVDVNYLLTDEDEFIFEARQKYGSRGAKDAQELVTDMVSLFAGGELPQEDKDAIFDTLQNAYWEVKLENKKYTPNKYKKGNDSPKE